MHYLPKVRFACIESHAHNVIRSIASDDNIEGGDCVTFITKRATLRLPLGLPYDKTKWTEPNTHTSRHIFVHTPKTSWCIYSVFFARLFVHNQHRATHKHRDFGNRLLSMEYIQILLGWSCVFCGSDVISVASCMCVWLSLLTPFSTHWIDLGIDNRPFAASFVWTEHSYYLGYYVNQACYLISCALSTDIVVRSRLFILELYFYWIVSLLTAILFLFILPSILR